MSESDSNVVTILTLGAEGGSITLEGQRDAAGAWRFRVATNEGGLGDLLDEELDEVRGGAPPWESWEGALTQLDRYPWPRLEPIGIHAEFEEAILNAVAAHELGGPEQVRRWRECIRMSRP